MAGQLIVAAIVGARRAHSVKELATACGVRPRTLEARLAREGFPRPHRVLSRLTVLYAVHLLECGHDSIDAASWLLGFGSRTAFEKYTMRQTGYTPRQLTQRSNFGELLEAFVGDLASSGKRV